MWHDGEPDNIASLPGDRSTLIQIDSASKSISLFRACCNLLGVFDGNHSPQFIMKAIRCEALLIANPFKRCESSGKEIKSEQKGRISAAFLLPEATEWYNQREQMAKAISRPSPSTLKS